MQSTDGEMIIVEAMFKSGRWCQISFEKASIQLFF